jgi:hypothetical protein
MPEGPPPVYYPHPAVLYPPATPYRVSRYAHWQYYSVTPQGQFRARVIYQPHAAFYLYDGAPYPWAATHPLELMPYARD